MSFTALGNWHPVNAVLFWFVLRITYVTIRASVIPVLPSSPIHNVHCSPDAFDVFPSA
jgi:hypothetical protein